ncbi:Os01g0683600 [Oryza sativa Japonica Group]|uniref:Os01g0683600 protein n=1 Tax=Oryza sativa subsp. japonica TaxID=39947 RepID=A0A0P0V6N0_ORYSJ|nr:Os01g0683600 [Oryza sativa Japonica Group]
MAAPATGGGISADVPILHSENLTSNVKSIYYRFRSFSSPPPPPPQPKFRIRSDLISRVMLMSVRLDLGFMRRHGLICSD